MSYEGFDDLEDEDHDRDAEDEEDVRRSWDPDKECIDELTTQTQPNNLWERGEVVAGGWLTNVIGQFHH